MPPLDRRLHAYRDDLADARLEGQVEAARFVEATRWQVGVGLAPLRREPSPEAGLVSELVFGETVLVYEDRNGIAWMQNETDGYVGYTDSAALSPAVHPPSHRVTAIHTCLFAEPHIRAPARAVLPMGSALCVTGSEGRYSRLATGGWVPTQHIAEEGSFERDLVAVAERFLGVPYLWGGRSSRGLDCSGLTQLSLARCGIRALRDSDMQEASLGAPVPFDGDESVLRRGDLVYWKGHCGIWVDNERFLHANASDMAVAYAPLREVIAWIEKIEGKPVSSVRRVALRG